MKIYSGLVNQKHMGVASPPYTDWAIFFMTTGPQICSSFLSISTEGKKSPYLVNQKIK